MTCSGSGTSFTTVPTQPIKILAGFPGVGKSTVKERFKVTDHHIVDLDSSAFSWIMTDGVKTPNPNFVKDYVSAIKTQVDIADMVLISTHEDTLKELMHQEIPFFVVVPDIDRKDEFLTNYKKRSNPDAFVTLVDTNWTNWIENAHALYKNQPLSTTITLQKGDFITDTVEQVLNLNRYD